MEELKFFKADGITPDENAQRLHELATRIVPDQIKKDAEKAKAGAVKVSKNTQLNDKG